MLLSVLKDLQGFLMYFQGRMVQMFVKDGKVVLKAIGRGDFAGRSDPVVVCSPSQVARITIDNHFTLELADDVVKQYQMGLLIGRQVRLTIPGVVRNFKGALTKSDGYQPAIPIAQQDWLYSLSEFGVPPNTNEYQVATRNAVFKFTTDEVNGIMKYPGGETICADIYVKWAME